MSAGRDDKARTKERKRLITKHRAERAANSVRKGKSKRAKQLSVRTPKA